MTSRSDGDRTAGKAEIGQLWQYKNLLNQWRSTKLGLWFKGERIEGLRCGGGFFIFIFFSGLAWFGAVLTIVYMPRNAKTLPRLSGRHHILNVKNASVTFTLPLN